ncbi:LysR substrate-binding domain-containing protein [Nisaea nitritireducens]|uniref:LysR substrate-binding domain-containing protein n=1 Tax=Nisaea nitritireducens TaxID=568392 RepID=UPI0018672B8F|nr:LysR substrate-binding domain-containing protein [Nisaea nitritireducens]
MLKNPLNLRQVEIFHAVMVNGTTQRAAEVLHISQPGISKALQELERQLGFALFHRTRRRLVPTAEAHFYFREVEESFAALSRLRSAAARIRDFGSGEIRIATLSALSTNIVPRALVRFRNLHPDVSITLQTHMSSTVKELVAAGQFDLGLAADEIDVSGVEAQTLSTFRGAIALPDGHPLCRKPHLEPQDLNDQDFIALSPEDTTRQDLERVLDSAGSRVRTVLETPFANTICAMVQAGMGIGFINPICAEPFLGKGIVLRPFEPSLEFRTLLVQPPAVPPSKIVRDCIDAFREETRATIENNTLYENS